MSEGAKEETKVTEEDPLGLAIIIREVARTGGRVDLTISGPVALSLIGPGQARDELSTLVSSRGGGLSFSTKGREFHLSLSVPPQDVTERTSSESQVPNEGGYQHREPEATQVPTGTLENRGTGKKVVESMARIADKATARGMSTTEALGPKSPPGAPKQPSE